MLSLHLSNLPQRPKSTSNFIRLVLKSINHQNEYVLRPSLKFPHTTTETLPDEIKLLDEQHQIIEISRSRSTKLSRTCFITFVSTDDATKFIESYQSKPLMINGRTIKIEPARKESLLTLSLDTEKNGLFNKIMVTRQKHKLLSYDQEFKKIHMDKRKQRRIRSKLRKQGLTDEEIIAKMLEFKKKETDSKSTQTSTESLQTSKESIEKVHTKPKIIDNPPSNRLLVQNIPKGTTKSELEVLFKGEGFQNVRLVEVRNVAFVEYTSIEHATVVMDTLGREPEFKSSTLYITFAK